MGIAALYFAILWRFDMIVANQSLGMQMQALINFVTSLIIFGYLSWSWLERKLGKWYLPLALAADTIALVFSNFLVLIQPAEVDLFLSITRMWMLIPILLVPLVLIAWQYSFNVMLFFTIFTNGVELLMLTWVVDEISIKSLPIIGMPVVQAFAFGTVGYIVGRLMDTQRSQKRKLIMANIQLGQQANTLEQLATSRERNRLARELHDTLAHTLSGTAVNLEAVKMMIDESQSEVLTMLDHSLRATRVGLDETRRALKDLRARPVEDLGLGLALKNLAGSIAERAGIEMDVRIPANLPNLPPDVEQSIYRIVQEALENTARHAGARHASLEMTASGGQIELVITDDGCGFDGKNHNTGEKYGIRGMKERAVAVGGSLDVTSAPGMGTRVCFLWGEAL